MADGARIIYRIFSAANNGVRSARRSKNNEFRLPAAPAAMNHPKIEFNSSFVRRAVPRIEKKTTLERTHTQSHIGSSASLQRTVFLSI